MPAAVRTPRDTWVKEGLRSLAAGGPDAIRIEALASALGVTKGGFYWHFRDRAALLEAVLDTWEQELVDEAIATSDRGGGDGRTRLRRLFAVAGAREDILGLELSVRDWARRDPAVAERVTRVDNRRMAYLRPLFAEFCDGPLDVEGRCLLVLTLLVGQSYVTATHGRRARRSVTAAALDHLLR
jgi:AcrR family transcriptional regulator